MLKEQRLKVIRQLLETTGMIKVSDIMEKLDVSDMTVRRDLDELEKSGILTRVHGGARLKDLYRIEELSHDEKQIVNIDKKRAIARQASRLIKKDETIFLGPGTTIEMLAEEISLDSLRIVTNCWPVFERLNKKKSSNSKIYLLGGEMRLKTQSFFGELVNTPLTNMKFHKAFFSCNALNENEVMTSTLEEGQTQTLALDNSLETYLLLDSSKLGKRDFCVYYQLKDITSVIIDDGARNVPWLDQESTYFA
ncbi:DeoR/GlpR family DNA-binding transcription regulator [Atopobacter phocae]|uniref:DeoR/GlpR family DNA-binding transcription regulator n=1 Tax=Atopobacter phocae TaxID=136492 RepID=UPI000472D5F6|nr:DeoR/GlpR family DNA-binding transcription regulator [Atopobacter phocae]